MKTYLLLNEIGEGTGTAVLSEKMKLSLPKEKMIGIHTLPPEIVEKIKNNPQHFLVESGNLRELNDEEKAAVDKKIEESRPKREKNTTVSLLMQKVTQLETKIAQLEKKA